MGTASYFSSRKYITIYCTFKIESIDDQNRHWVIATMQEWSGVGWRTRTSFHVYNRPRPATDLSSVATQDDIVRYIFVKGE